MKPYSLLALFLSSSALAQPVGVNVPPLRPGYTVQDDVNAEGMYKLAAPGSFTRFSTIQWEKPQNNWRGIDRQLELCKAYNTIPFILLQPLDKWGTSDNWFFQELEIPTVLANTELIVRHINDKCKTLKLTPWFQLWNEPAGRSVNPPIGEKPGGSTKTVYGEWPLLLHKILNAEVDMLKKCGVPGTRIVSPAFSCLLENNTRAQAELITGVPPKAYNWLGKISNVSIHIGGSASWANVPETRASFLMSAFENNAGYCQMILKNYAPLANKKFIVTEFYATPARFGMQLNPDKTFTQDVTDFCTIEVDQFKLKGFNQIIVWNGPPESQDGWGYFRLWDGYLAKQKVKSGNIN